MKKSILSLFVVCALILLVGCKPTPELVNELKGQTAEQIFNQAEQYLAKGKYSDALKYFEALDALYPFGKYAEQGLLDSVYAYYETEDYGMAYAASDRYIRTYPSSSHVDYVYYMQGMANFKRERNFLQKVFGTARSQNDLQYLRDSYNSFNTLVTLFPHSSYAPDAARRMVFIRNVLADHELQIAEFYLQSKAYVAAANRAADVVQNYQGSPEVIRALGVMVKAYRALGETELADQTYQLLQSNYPNSETFKGLKNQ